MNLRYASTIAAAVVVVVALSGCVAKSDGQNLIEVTSTATTCDLTAATTSSGPIDFRVTNVGAEVTEFYLLASDGLRIVGEIENVTPGASRTLSVTAQPGDYLTLCKPGMLGAGVGRAAFSVTGDAVEVTGPDADQKQHAVDLYLAFVKDQVGQLVPAAESFVEAYKAGDDVAARAAFPIVRSYYERIEPVASTLGDLDPRIDYREVDAVAEGLDWTGFHRVEKDLWAPTTGTLNSDGTSALLDWSPSTPVDRARFGDLLVADIGELYDYVHSDEFQATLDSQGIAAISNGAIGLLDEVATGKITGEEDWWSGTDLYDFAANVEGAKMAFTLVRDFASTKGEAGAKLVADIDDGFVGLEASLAKQGSLTSEFVGYRELSDADKRELVDQINALAEPLSRLTSTILG